MKLDLIKSRFSRIANNDTILFTAITFLCLYYFLISQSVILDDAFIYFRIVNNLIAIGKPVINAGDAYFVATSPLWVLILTISKVIFPFFTLELIAKLWWAILLIAASVFAYYTFYPFIGRWAIFTACPFFLSPIISSITGNEIALLYLAMFGLIWACVTQKPIYSGLFLGLGYLARGEFVLAIIPVFLYFIPPFKKQPVDWKQVISNLLKISAVALVVVLPWHGYYFLTFHSFFPRTFSVKILQGQSGLWILFPQAIWYYLTQLLRGNMYLLSLTLLGAWRQPYLFRFMALYTLCHTVAYTVLKIPYYHWYYYDYYIFILILTLFGIFDLIKTGNSLISQLTRSSVLSNLIKRIYHLASSFVFLCVFILIFPMKAEIFLPSHFSDIFQNSNTDPRYNSYVEISNQLLGEIRPTDIVLAGEIGILSYVLQGYEIRDINGLASPNITISNMQNWDYFVDYYKPRYIMYRGGQHDEFKYYKYNNFTYAYKRHFFIPETKTHSMTSIYIRIDTRSK